jgi:hypothetical protein
MHSLKKRRIFFPCVDFLKAQTHNFNGVLAHFHSCEMVHHDTEKVGLCSVQMPGQCLVNAVTVHVELSEYATNQAQRSDNGGTARLPGDILQSWTDVADGFIFCHPFIFPRAL